LLRKQNCSDGLIRPVCGNPLMFHPRACLAVSVAGAGPSMSAFQSDNPHPVLLDCQRGGLPANCRCWPYRRRRSRTPAPARWGFYVTSDPASISDRGLSSYHESISAVQPPASSLIWLALAPSPVRHGVIASAARKWCFRTCAGVHSAEKLTRATSQPGLHIRNKQIDEESG